VHQSSIQIQSMEKGAAPTTKFRHEAPAALLSLPLRTVAEPLSSLRTSEGCSASALASNPNSSYL
jgi:hypothetical protein